LKVGPPHVKRYSMGSSQSPIKVSAVLPAYNEAENIEKTIFDLNKVLLNNLSEYEIIVVDDGSQDDTFKKLAALSEENQAVKVLRHELNKGYGAALRTGFESASFSWLFFMDSDGQFDAEEFVKLLELTDKNDFIAGYRTQRMDPKNRILYGRVFSFLVRTIFGVKIRDINCAFKLFKKELVDDCGLSVDGALINTEILIAAKKKGVHPVEVGVTHLPRKVGTQTGGSIKVIISAFSELFGLVLKK
jgi:glycosyltransferase involved in cell wall biosynthesis